MDAPGRGRPLLPLPPLRIAIIGVGVLLLAALAAAAARPAGEPSLGPGSPTTTAAVIRAVGILIVMGEVALIALLFFVRRPRAGGRLTSPRRPLVTILVAAVQLAAAALVFHLYRQSLLRGNGLIAGAGIPARSSVGRSSASTAGGQEWLTALIVVGVLLVVALLLARHLRARRATSKFDQVALRLRVVVDLGLEGLEEERDPRRAVIAAYARMEIALAGVGLPREPHEAALEYLGRLLRQLGADSTSATRLTELFQHAKFSRHPVGPGMKSEAISALRSIRDDLDGWAAAALRGESALASR